MGEKRPLRYYEVTYAMRSRTGKLLPIHKAFCRSQALQRNGIARAKSEINPKYEVLDVREVSADQVKATSKCLYFNNPICPFCGVSVYKEPAGSRPLSTTEMEIGLFTFMR